VLLDCIAVTVDEDMAARLTEQFLELSSQAKVAHKVPLLISFISRNCSREVAKLTLERSTTGVSE
jgi:hypothetical protein